MLKDVAVILSEVPYRYFST